MVPRSPVTVTMAILCLRVRVCVHACTKKKGEMDGLAAPIMVSRSVLHEGATTGELLLV